MSLVRKSELMQIAKEKISDQDVSHDFQHALRVLSNVEKIAKQEGGNLEVLIPAALFQDLIVYPKNHPHRLRSQEESAVFAAQILQDLNYKPEIINQVKTCILECSFSKGIIPDLLESKILQDADSLEATGAISIMRTFSSSGQMKRPFYHAEDPFAETRDFDDSGFALDLFFTRLLKVEDRMHTATAKKIARNRTDFLYNFLEQTKKELSLMEG